MKAVSKIAFSFLLIALLLVATGRTASLRCDLTPAGIVAERTRKDAGRYSIEISGNPETYVPGEQYTGKQVFSLCVSIFNSINKERLIIMFT